MADGICANLHIADTISICLFVHIICDFPFCDNKCGAIIYSNMPSHNSETSSSQSRSTGQRGNDRQPSILNVLWSMDPKSNLRNSGVNGKLREDYPIIENLNQLIPNAIYILKSLPSKGSRQKMYIQFLRKTDLILHVKIISVNMEKYDEATETITYTWFPISSRIINQISSGDIDHDSIPQKAAHTHVVKNKMFTNRSIRSDDGSVPRGYRLYMDPLANILPADFDMNDKRKIENYKQTLVKAFKTTDELALPIELVNHIFEYMTGRVTQHQLKQMLYGRNSDNMNRTRNGGKRTICNTKKGRRTRCRTLRGN